MPINLLELYKQPSINQISGFCNAIKQIDPEALASAYHACRESAPQRTARGKPYFIGHDGLTRSGSQSNRREEHLAVALWNHAQLEGPLMLPGGRSLSLLDYQFPLKARQSDQGVGKVDLFGLMDNSTACVIELKIQPVSGSLGDTPLRAFLEALAYCAIVEANASAIADEAGEKFGMRLSGNRPSLMVMANAEYWAAYAMRKSAGDWWPALHQLSSRLASLLGLECHFISLRNPEFSMGLEGKKPVLAGKVELDSVEASVQFRTS